MPGQCVFDKHMGLEADRSKEELCLHIAVLFMDVFAVQRGPGSV